jgi:hypothetical protein
VMTSASLGKRIGRSMGAVSCRCAMVIEADRTPMVVDLP